MYIFVNFRTFLKLSKCKALGDFLVSFSETTIPTGYLGGKNQNSIFRNCMIWDSRYIPTLNSLVTKLKNVSFFLDCIDSEYQESFMTETKTTIFLRLQTFCAMWYAFQKPPNILVWRKWREQLFNQTNIWIFKEFNFAPVMISGNLASFRIW